MNKGKNLFLGKKFAKKFNKKYGIITYSGTLAIEVALLSLNLQKKDKVLVLSEVCYSIVNTILKLGLTPIILTPKNGLYMTDEDITEMLNKEDIDCIMLVHQYGLLNSIDKKKYKDMGIRIIEDIAQAWDIGNNQYLVGKYSDIVVTSFGNTKPLSYGVGGGLFFDDKILFNSLDFCDNTSRECKNILLSYVYPLCEYIDFDKLTQLADILVNEQRTNANEYCRLLKKQNIIKYISNDSLKINAWHRFPIWVNDYNLYKKLIHKFENSNLKYQLPHKIELGSLKRNKKCIKHSNMQCKSYFILLRTRNINISEQIKILAETIDDIQSI